MGSYPISNMAHILERKTAEAGRKTEEALRLQANAGQVIDHANQMSQDAYHTNDKATHMWDRATDLMVKGRTEAQRKNDALYQSQVHKHPMNSNQIQPIAVPPSHTPIVYGQPTPQASPVLHATGVSYGPFQHNLPTASDMSHLQAAGATYAQAPHQFADLTAANQMHALAQQPGLALNAQDQAALEAYIRHLQASGENPQAALAAEHVNPLQAPQNIGAEHDVSIPFSTNSVVSRYLTRTLKLPSFKAFKEQHPELRQKIDLLSAELPAPVKITSKVPGKSKPLGKDHLLNEEQKLNDQRTHIQKLINSSKEVLSDKTEVGRYRDELDRVTRNLQTIIDGANRRTRQGGTQDFLNKADTRQLVSYATQLSQTAEQLRATLNQHHEKMPTKKDQARNFTEALASLDQELKNEFVNAYPEAVSDTQRRQLRRKLQQSNQEIRDHLSHELPVTAEANTPGVNAVRETKYTVGVRSYFLNRLKPISQKDMDALTEYEKPNLQMGEAFKILGIGSVLSGAGYSLLKASPLKSLADPFAKLAFGGTLAGTLFSALPAKFTAPIIEGDVPKAFKQLMERSNVKPQAPGRNSTSSDHVKYFFQSNW